MSAPPIKVFIFALPPVEVAGHMLVHSWAVTHAGRWCAGGVSHQAANAIDYCRSAVASKAPNLFGALPHEVCVVDATDPELRAAIETALERQP